MGSVKGQTAIRVFKKFPYLREHPYWGNYFWANWYCVDTVGLDAEMIWKYIIHQERNEREKTRDNFFQGITQRAFSEGAQRSPPLGGISKAPSFGWGFGHRLLEVGSRGV